MCDCGTIVLKAWSAEAKAEVAALISGQADLMREVAADLVEDIEAIIRRDSAGTEAASSSAPR